MLQLSLHPTIVGNRPMPNDFVVIWTSDSFGARRVGRIRLATQHLLAERWEWSINLPMPVPAWGHGIARSRPMANAAFKRIFEKFHSQTTARQWADAFAAQGTSEERLQREKQRRADVWRE